MIDAQRQFPKAKLGGERLKKRSQWYWFQKAIADKIDQEIKKAGKWQAYTGRYWP